MPQVQTNEEKYTLLSSLRLLGNRFHVGFIVTDPKNDDAIVFVNESFTETTGYSLEEVYGTNLRFLQGEATDMNLIKKIDGKLREAQPVNEEILNYKKDGTPFWNELVIQPILSEDKEILLNVSFILDVTKRKSNELLLKLQEKVFVGINEGQQLDEVLHTITEVVKSILPMGMSSSIVFKDSNDKWSVKAPDSISNNELLSIKDEVIAKGKKGYGHPIHLKELTPNANHEFNYARTYPLFNRDGIINGMLMFFKESTNSLTNSRVEELEKIIPVIELTKTFYDQQERYRKLAYTDPQTGLPNRNGFMEELKKRLDNKGSYFVTAIQPSEYTNVIDIYGRDAGDELFIELGRRLRKIGKESENFVGRGSSSTLFLTNELIGSNNGHYYLLQLRKVVSKPFIIKGKEIYITLKSGIAVSRKEEIKAEELFRQADVALTFAKRQSGNAFSFYKDTQSTEAIQEITIFNELTKALFANEVSVYFQPKVSLNTSEVIGFEALARWKSPTLGDVPPNQFIPTAEKTGKIIDLETEILTLIIKWLKSRKQAGVKQYQVAVNVSVEHFLHSSFVPRLKKLVKKYDIEPSYLLIEITESLGLVDFDKGKLIVNRLARAGFKVSIDDFGKGFSSLSYLAQLKVSELKIDRSFINELDKPDTQAVVRTIIQLANNLNLTIVAEGIEKEEQIEVLQSFGCEVGQGFYYYKPMPLDEIDLLLEGK